MSSSVIDMPAAGPASPPRSRLGLEIRETLLVGGLTPLMFLVSWLLRRRLSLDEAEYGISFAMFYLAFVINDPHFAVTYLLFYRDARARALGDVFTPLQRVRYLVAGFLVPAALFVWLAVALASKSATTLGYAIQLMFALVGWHYVKQGFGVMAVLGARRGIFFRPYERIIILAHCFAGWAHAWASHGYPGVEVEQDGVVYTSLARPGWIDDVTFYALAATVPPLLIALAVKAYRDGRAALMFAPLTGLLCSVWAWTLFSGIDPLVRYMIPALHSIQYLYFVYLLSRREAEERQGPPWFERSVRVRVGILAFSALALGLVLIRLAPWALDDGLVRGKDRALPLGPTPYFAAFSVFINIHHYFMDHVIWRRDNPLMRYLRAT